MATKELISQIDEFKNGNYYVRVKLKGQCYWGDTLDGEIQEFTKDKNNIDNSYLTIKDVPHISDNFPQKKSNYNLVISNIESIDELKSSEYLINRM